MDHPPLPGHPVLSEVTVQRRVLFRHKKCHTSAVKVLGVVCSALLLVALPLTVHTAPPPPAVLILLPGQPTGTQSGVDAFAAGARRALLDGLPSGSSVYIEYTDLARLGDGEEPGKLRDWYRTKYADRGLDLLIASGQEARAFLLRFRRDLWADVPIIFAGMDQRSLRSATLPAGTTAVTTQYDEEGTIRAALTLMPDTQHVALVVGASRLDRYLGTLWREALARVGDRLQVIDLVGLPLEELRKRLGDLPPRTIVLFSTMFADGNGRGIVTPEVLPGLAAAANRPIFTIHGSLMGLGVVGGSLVDYSALGRQTAGVALSVLRGLPMPAEPVKVPSVNTLLFDWRELRRWGLDERRLPKGSTVCTGRRPRGRSIGGRSSSAARRSSSRRCSSRACSCSARSASASNGNWMSGCVTRRSWPSSPDRSSTCQPMRSTARSRTASGASASSSASSA